MEKYYSDLDLAESREWLEFFKNLKIFRGWSLDSLKNVLQYTKACKFNQKQVVLSNTKQLSDVYIVKSGNVLVWTQLKRNTNSINKYIKKRAHFQEPSMNSTSFLSNQKLITSSSNTPSSSSKTEFQHSHSILTTTTAFDRRRIDNNDSKTKFYLTETSKNFNDKDFHLPDINAKPHINFEKSKNQWNNYFQKQSTFYLQILKLRKGDVFGLDSNLMNDHPNCQLISDECEVFVINKDAFMNYSPVEFYEVLQYQYNQNLPSKDEIDTKFAEYVKWKNYRKKVFQETAIQRVRSKIASFR